MKKTVGYIFLIVVLASTPLWAQRRDTYLYDLDEHNLSVRLALSAEQLTNLRAMLKMLQAQRDLDRQNFAGNVQALIAAGLRRVQMAETIMLKDMNDAQKLRLAELKNMQARERQFFEINESLDLTVEQRAKLRAVLDIYKDLPEIGERDQMDTRSSADYISNDRGIDPRTGRVSGFNQGLRNGRETDFNSREIDRERAIDEVLTKEQRKQFDLLKREWQKQREGKTASRPPDPGSERR
jgi:hypothetical protein